MTRVDFVFVLNGSGGKTSNKVLLHNKHQKNTNTNIQANKQANKMAYPPPQGSFAGPQGSFPPPQQGSMYPPQQPGMYPPQQGSMYPPQQPPPGSMYPPQQGSMYPPQQPQDRSMYPPPQGSMYPPQPQGSMYPPQQQPYPGGPPPMGAYPPGGSMYPPQQQPYPGGPAGGYPPGGSMYPPQQPYPGGPGPQGGVHGGATAMMGPSEVTLQFSGRKLANKDILSKSDPFLIVYKKKNITPGEKFQKTSYHGEMHAAEWTAIQKTEVVKDNLNPNWKPFKINVQMVGGMDAPLLLEVVDWDSNGTNDLIGRQLTSLNELKTVRDAILLDPKKKNSFRYKNSGTLTVSFR